MKICYISDFLLSDIVGGGELNDHELCIKISQVEKIDSFRCREIKMRHLKQYSHFIVSNFVTLSPYFLEFLTKECKYVIYEHDHKYLINRNPSKFKNFTAPPSAIVNREFYKNAKAVFCQSSFHESIILRNLKEINVVNLSGNLWSFDSLDIMKTLSGKEKKNSYSILNSKTPHKNTRGALLYCNSKGYNSELIASGNYQEFLSKLSNNKSFIFLPETPETLSRVVVESRMMNMKTIINKNIGASYEPWFKMKGEDLINYMREKRKSIPNIVLKHLKE